MTMVNRILERIDESVNLSPNEYLSLLKKANLVVKESHTRPIAIAMSRAITNGASFIIRRYRDPYWIIKGNIKILDTSLSIFAPQGFSPRIPQKTRNLRFLNHLGGYKGILIVSYFDLDLSRELREVVYSKGKEAKKKIIEFLNITEKEFEYDLELLTILTRFPEISYEAHLVANIMLYVKYTKSNNKEKSAFIEKEVQV